MSMTAPRIGSIRRRYGRQRAQAAADATPQAVLNFQQPPSGESWVITRVFIRGAAGMTVRLFVGSDPGDPNNADPMDEVDSVITTAAAPVAVSTGDEIAVDPLEAVWALVTGIVAGTVVSGQIRYHRRLFDEY